MGIKWNWHRAGEYPCMGNAGNKQTQHWVCKPMSFYKCINTTHLSVSLYACPANHLHALTSSKSLEHGCFEVIGQNILSIRSLQPSFKTSWCLLCQSLVPRQIPQLVCWKKATANIQIRVPKGVFSAIHWPQLTWRWRGWDHSGQSQSVEARKKWQRSMKHHLCHSLIASI